MTRNNFSMSHAEEEWSALFPSQPTHGWVRLGPEGRPFLVTAHHQLHCLESLRRIFTAASCTTDAPADVDWHVQHCLNGLRQAVLCNADTALEPSFEYQLADGSTSPAATGMGVDHVCRDWSQMDDYIEGNRREWLGKPFPSVL